MTVDLEIFFAGLRSDEILQKFYELDDLLSKPLDQVLAYARTLEGAIKR